MSDQRALAGPPGVDDSSAPAVAHALRTRVARFVHRPATVVGGAMLVALMLLTVADVVLRFALGRPIRGTFELTELAMVAVALLGLGYAQHLGEHITIGLLYERLPAGWRRALDVLAGLTSLLLTVAITWQLGRHFGRMRDSGEVTAVLGLPVYPVVSMAVVGFALFAVALLSGLVGSIRRAKGG